MTISIERNPLFAESNITYIGITNIYGKPQFILVNSDEGNNDKLKFPGLRFSAPESEKETLEDVASNRFEEQTGLTIEKSLGLRTIIPTRSRHGNRWIFRNVFVGLVDDTIPKRDIDNRKVYVADPGQGLTDGQNVSCYGDTKIKAPLDWVVDDNQIISRVANGIINNLDRSSPEQNRYNRIPCVGVPPQSETYNPELNCSIAVASMILLYQPNPNEPQKIVMVRRKNDSHPGYAGGKIETLNSPESQNIDPVSCCIQEGSEELGFDVIANSLVGVAMTPTYVPNGKGQDYYNGIVNYCFIARPSNPLKVKEALENPKKHLEGKMAEYVVENFDAFRDRTLRGDLRMPDMIPLANLFYEGSPSTRITLDHIRASGNY